MIDPLKAAEKAMDFADDSFESREESETTRTRRQEIDMTSPFKLPQLIRPILAIWGATNFTLVEFILLYQGVISPLEAMATNAAIVMAIIGFYFNSRKAEKIVAKQMSGQLEIVTMKAKTAVKLEELSTRKAIKEETKANKAERKEDRQERRQERRDARD